MVQRFTFPSRAKVLNQNRGSDAARVPASLNAKVPPRNPWIRNVLLPFVTGVIY
jgi:hypothetical protein